MANSGNKINKWMLSSGGARFGADSHGFLRNLLAVTIGNVVGGAVLVAGAYWLLYRRPKNTSRKA